MDNIFLIECRTGCSCCSYENHYRGPYKTFEDAEKRIKYFQTSDYYPIASQFARRGRYNIKTISVEKIPGERFILDSNRVIDCLNFIEVNKDGSIDNKYGSSKNDYILEEFSGIS